MLGLCRSRLADAGAFATCVVLYWLRIFPRTRTEIQRWQERALSIPDERLRELALATQQGERGNLEGAAAFALLAPARMRAAVVRAAVAFQTAYDYVDTLAEETSADPRTNALRLHLVLLAALDERRRHPSLEDCRLAAHGEDGGYLASVLAECREALQELPSYPTVRSACLHAVTRMAVYQSLIHAPALERDRMRSWALRLGEDRSEETLRLRWWETAAGAASSLIVFALFAAAAQPALDAEESATLERAYFPFVGALHVLLDSLADRDADARSGHYSLVSHYGSLAAACKRLTMLAEHARAELAPLAHAGRHQAVLISMVGFYLASLGTGALEVSGLRSIRAGAGPLARPATAMLRARRAASRCRELLAPERLFAGAHIAFLESQVVDFPLAALRAPQR